MNHIQEISTQCQTLPEDLQKQVLDFIYFLEARYRQKSSKDNDKPLTNTELEQTALNKRNSVILGLMADEFAIPVDFDRPLPETFLNDFYTDNV